MGENMDHTLVNPNQMRHHRLNVKDKTWSQKPMGIICHEEEVTAVYQVAFILLG